ncbi:MAG: hypothetical protein JOZ83_02640 [Silvibacterium sp.]|nr:hypothetical protein [Silvibacterium sp.]
MRVIFSCENTAYMRWQADLLHHSFRRSGMRAELTALVSETGGLIDGFPCETVRVSNYKTCVPNEIYEPLNKPGAICEWASRGGSPGETVLIVDTDSFFLRPVPDPGSLRRGEACADAHDYMRPELDYVRPVLDRHCAPQCRSLFQPVGIYILIRRDDLAALAPRWLEKAVSIRSDKVCRAQLPHNGWISEMVAYAIAAAECGVRHRISGIAQSTGTGSLKCPIIHYCFPVNLRGGEWSPEQKEPVLWSKWDYEPWEHPPVEQAPTPESRELLQGLAELAAKKRAAATQNGS